jgi:hypothetical protein
MIKHPEMHLALIDRFEKQADELWASIQPLIESMESAPLDRDCSARFQKLMRRYAELGPRLKETSDAVNAMPEHPRG